MDYYQLKELKRIKDAVLDIAGDLSSLKYEVAKEQDKEDEVLTLETMFAKLITATEKADRILSQHELD